MDAKETPKGWTLWPEKGAEPATVQMQSMDAIQAAGIRDAADRKAETRVSYGTIGWIVLGIAAAVGIALAAGGGGDDGGNVVVNPGQQ